MTRAWIVGSVLAVLAAGCGSADTIPKKQDAAVDAASGDAAVPAEEASVASDLIAPDMAGPDTAAAADAELTPDAGTDAATAEGGSPDAAPLALDAGPDAVAMCGRINCDCTFDGKKLYGRFKVVDTFADFKVRMVDVFPDLRVQKVTVFADGCGKWQQDDSFPDFTVQIVDTFEDFSIQYVDAFPGLPP